MDVARAAYVANVSETCCKSLFKMFHLFQTYVPSILIRMFAYVSHICCNNMFYMFNMFQTNVASVLSGCCTCYNDYVVSVCSKCFICFSRMLQLFHLSVAKVDLNVELFSKEERASAGAMVTSAVSWRQRSIEGRTGTRSPFPYDMLPPPKVLEQKLVASPHATEMQTLTMEVTQAR